MHPRAMVLHPRPHRARLSASLPSLLKWVTNVPQRHPRGVICIESAEVGVEVGLLPQLTATQISSRNLRPRKGEHLSRNFTPPQPCTKPKPV